MICNAKDNILTSALISWNQVYKGTSKLPYQSRPLIAVIIRKIITYQSSYMIIICIVFKFEQNRYSPCNNWYLKLLSADILQQKPNLHVHLHVYSIWHYMHIRIMQKVHVHVIFSGTQNFMHKESFNVLVITLHVL